AAAHQIIHQVVAVRHVVKDLVDEALLVLDGHGLLAEMGGFARLGHGSCLLAGLCLRLSRFCAAKPLRLLLEAVSASTWDRCAPYIRRPKKPMAQTRAG